MSDELVYLAPVEWHGLRQRPQEIARLLAEDFLVTYVNPVATRNLSWRDLGRLRSFARGLRAGAPAAAAPPPVRVASLLHLPFAGVARLTGLNERLLEREIRRKLAPQPGYLLCVAVPSPAATAFLRCTRPGRVVYDCMDHYSFFHQGEHAARMRAIEDEVLERSDVVFTSAESLREVLARRHRNVVLAPNGANIGLFRCAAGGAAAAAPELEALPGPLLGYCGTIGDWVDFDLLAALARRFSDCTLVLIGPWRARAGRGLLSLPNVRWLGERPHDAVPAYCLRFAVGLIPFALNDLSSGVNPIKLYEYLSLGLPVVSTAIPEALRHQPFVRAARTREDFLDAVRESLRPQDEEARESRSRYASSFSWERTADIIRGVLRPSFEDKSASPA